MKVVVFLVINFFCFLINAQVLIGIDTAIASALRTNPKIQLSQLDVKQKKALIRGSYNLENPSIGIEAPYGNKFEINVQQNFQNPLIYVQQAKLGKQNILLSEENQHLTKWQLIRDVRTVYLNLQYAEILVKQLSNQDSIFHNIFLSSARLYEAGDLGLLEKVSAETKSKEIENTLLNAKADLKNAQLQLQLIAGLKALNYKADEVIGKSNTKLPDGLEFDSAAIKKSALLSYYEQNTKVQKQNLNLQKTKLLPGLSFGYLNQVGEEQPINFHLRYGITLPLWFWTYSSEIKVAKYQYKMSQSQYAIAQNAYSSKYAEILNDIGKNTSNLNYYEKEGIKQAELIKKTAKRSYDAGEISIVIYLYSLNEGFEIEQRYNEAIRNFNQAIIELNYLIGQ